MEKLDTVPDQLSRRVDRLIVDEGLKRRESLYASIKHLHDVLRNDLAPEDASLLLELPGEEGEDAVQALERDLVATDVEVNPCALERVPDVFGSDLFTAVIALLDGFHREVLDFDVLVAMLNDACKELGFLVCVDKVLPCALSFSLHA